MASEALIKLWAVTSWDEYQNEWASSVGPFDELSEYQESLGFTSPEDFFNKQAIAAQILANDRIGDILERVYSTKDLTSPVRQQLKKFTYQAIDFIRANDLIIVEDVRQQQTTINNQRLDSSLVNIDRLEDLVGAAAWRSFTLAGLEKLYTSWAQTQDIPYLLDPTRFYDKEEIDHELSLIDDQIQVQQKLIDKKLAEFNVEMEEKLTAFRTELNDDPDLIANVGDNLTENLEFINETAKKINASLVTEKYVEEKLEPKADKTDLIGLESKTDHAKDIATTNAKFIDYETAGSHNTDVNRINQKFIDYETVTAHKNDLTTVKSNLNKVFVHFINVSANSDLVYNYQIFLEGDGYYLVDFGISVGSQSTYDYNGASGSVIVRYRQNGNLDYYLWTPGTTNRDAPNKWYITYLQFAVGFDKEIRIRTLKYIDGSTLTNITHDYTLKIFAKRMGDIPVDVMQSTLPPEVSIDIFPQPQQKEVVIEPVINESVKKEELD